MKFVLPFLLSATSLFSIIIEKDSDILFNIYSKKSLQSDITATVSTNKGIVDIQRCSNTQDNVEWCKIKYNFNGLDISGYAEKEVLEFMATKPNTKSTFQQRYGGRYSDVGNAILALNDGMLLVGSTESYGKGQHDVYVVKVDKLGNRIWSKSFGGGRMDEGKDVVETKDGFIIAGSTSSFGNRARSIYLSKVTKDGSLNWHKAYYSDNDDYYSGNSIAKDGDNFIVAGYEDHVEFFNSEVNGYVNGIDSKGRRYAIKYYGGKDVEKINSIISVSNGYVFVGETDTWGNGDKDVFVVKVNKSGEAQWDRAYGFKHDDVGKQVIQTKDGGYLIVGYTDIDRENKKDIYVIKLNRKGDKEWHYYYGTKEDDEGNSVVEVDDGYVIAGYTNNTKFFNSDAYLLKIDRKGVVVWSRQYGGEDEDRANAIAKVGDGLAITGFMTSKDTYSKDLYLIRTDLNGNIE